MNRRQIAAFGFGMSRKVVNGTKQPVELSCPCGKPLSIARLDDGRWALGHFEAMCSPLIHGTDANDVLEKFVELVQDDKFDAKR